MNHPRIHQNSRRRGMYRCRGLSLIEMLIALSITAVLLTATMMAIVASFDAYAAAAESASTQTTTRLVIYRLLTLIRTSTAQGPLLPNSAAGVTMTDNDILTSPYIEMIDSKGDLIRIDYHADTDQLWVTTTPFGSTTSTSEPLLGGVTQAVFHLRRRLDNQGVWILERGSVELTVMPDDDSTLAAEKHAAAPIHLIASTIPRRLLDQ